MGQQELLTMRHSYWRPRLRFVGGGRVTGDGGNTGEARGDRGGEAEGECEDSATEASRYGMIWDIKFKDT